MTKSDVKSVSLYLLTIHINLNGKKLHYGKELQSSDY